jgi:hypothetical protein
MINFLNVKLLVLSVQGINVNDLLPRDRPTDTQCSRYGTDMTLTENVHQMQAGCRFPAQNYLVTKRHRRTPYTRHFA